MRKRPLFAAFALVWVAVAVHVAGQMKGSSLLAQGGSCGNCPPNYVCCCGFCSPPGTQCPSSCGGGGGDGPPPPNQQGNTGGMGGFGAGMCGNGSVDRYEQMGYLEECDYKDHYFEVYGWYRGCDHAEEICNTSCKCVSGGSGGGAGDDQADDGSTDAGTAVQAGTTADGQTISGQDGVPEKCGDGTLQEDLGEQCDDENAISGDGCNRQCKRETGFECTETGCSSIHGDGLIVKGEQCDDKNLDAGDGCSSTGKVENGWLLFCTVNPAGEKTKTCRVKPKCGDRVRTGKEACDAGGIDTKECDSDCTKPKCGDGHTNKTTKEECDGGTACTAKCSLPRCGDGIVTKAEPYKEFCDDGNTSDAVGWCSADCKRLTTTPEGGSVAGGGGTRTGGKEGGAGTLTGGKKGDDDGTNTGKNGGNGTLTGDVQGGGGKLTGGQGGQNTNGPGGEGRGGEDTRGFGGQGQGGQNTNGPGGEGQGGEDTRGFGGENTNGPGGEPGENGDTATSSCGNGVEEGEEECDDGNQNDDDTCNNTCKKTYCGDAKVQQPNGDGQVEECDGAPGCSEECAETFCGDKEVQQPNSDGQREECDAGSNCSNDLLKKCRKNASCGDGTCTTQESSNCTRECKRKTRSTSNIVETIYLIIGLSAKKLPVSCCMPEKNVRCLRTTPDVCMDYGDPRVKGGQAGKSYSTEKQCRKAC